MGDTVIHCYYIHNALLLNCEIHCPGHGTEVEGFFLNLGAGDDKYSHILNMYFRYLLIILVYHFWPLELR